MYKLLLILSTVNLSAQINHNVKIDTLFFSGNIPKINKSKTRYILKDVQNTCDTSQKEFFNGNIEANREFRTISILKLFNKEAKTSLFTDADAVVVSYFCQNIDYVNEIELYEFIFQSNKQAQDLLDKLAFLKKKPGFNDYIGYKNWYFKRVENVVYFVDYKEESPANVITDRLKLNISLILK